MKGREGKERKGKFKQKEGEVRRGRVERES